MDTTGGGDSNCVCDACFACRGLEHPSVELMKKVLAAMQDNKCQACKADMSESIAKLLECFAWKSNPNSAKFDTVSN